MFLPKRNKIMVRLFYGHFLIFTFISLISIIFRNTLLTIGRNKITWNKSSLHDFFFKKTKQKHKKVELNKLHFRRVCCFIKELQAKISTSTPALFIVLLLSSEWRPNKADRDPSCSRGFAPPHHKKCNWFIISNLPC